MPVRKPELSALAVGRLAEPGLHAVGGVVGLYLRITPTLGKSWVLRAVIGPRRTDVGLGSFPSVTLAQARDKARSARAMIEGGVDPVAAKAEAKARLNVVATPTFAKVAADYFAIKKSEWGSPRHGHQWWSSVEMHAIPIIGKLPIDKIGTDEVLRVLEPIWLTQTMTAKKLMGRLSAVFSYAKAKKLRTGDDPADWRGSLKALLPAPGKVTKVQNFAAMPLDTLPGFVQALAGRDDTPSKALLFTILTGARSGETRGATWDEIDLEAAAWSIPAERMKMARPHIVPLVKEAVTLLAALPRTTGQPLVFTATRGGGQLSDKALGLPLRALGHAREAATVHGFRACLSTWANGYTSHPHEVIEASLAHSSTKVVAAYNRSSFIEKRRQLLDDWELFLITKK